MTVDPRIVRMVGEITDYCENTWSPYKGVTVEVDRRTRQMYLTTAVEGPVLDAPNGMLVHAFFKLEDIDELLRDLLAARADLMKLAGGK